MVFLAMNGVTVDFPLYGAQRSLRSALFGGHTGGSIRRDGRSGGRVTVRALEDITLDVRSGDRLALVGHNGAGKSTLLRVMAGVYEPTNGHIEIGGKVSPLFNVSPGLDHDDTGYENIMTCGLFLGMSREEIVEKTPEIAAFSELGEYLHLPVRTYSTGMLTRLGFAIATAIDPEILLLDEGLGAGDARFAEKARARVASLVNRANILILASHSSSLLRQMCNKAALLQHGRLLVAGDIEPVMVQYDEMVASGAM
jgi:ABC-type polysaccharide/polyol phosphate transport system ATPase subunit